MRQAIICGEVLHFFSKNSSFLEFQCTFKDFPDLLIINFLNIIGFKRTHQLFNLIFMITHLQQRPKYDIFQKALFCTLASNTNLFLNFVRIRRGSIYGEVLIFFC